MTLPARLDQPTPPPAGPSRRRRWFWPLAGLVLATGSVSILLVNRLPAAPVAAPVETAEAPRLMQLHPSEIIAVEPRPMEELVKVTGIIHPAREAPVAALVGGTAETVAVEAGDRVEAGQVLVEIGTTDLQLQLDQQQGTMASTAVQLQAAKATLERTRQLADRELAARTTLDAAQAEVDQLTASLAAQQSQVALARTNLERARVLAPFSGTIASRAVGPGQIVSPGTTMLSIVDLSTVTVEVIAPLRDSARIRVGQTVRLSVQGMPEASFTSTVERLSPVAEAGTRSIKIYLRLDNPDGLLRGGMFVSGDIIVQRDDAVLAVPATAVHTRDDAPYVLALENGIVRERPIRTGTEWPSAGLVEARSGLSAGDTIVAASLAGLSAGTAVAIGGN
ncbi:efflux RND transporter periplasmic adaptor subunit [Devosia albogilva]|uniref:Efflux RND transporter periplasmic adaptor subunit n=1 Tax=Devosia albogilva TaxID=429726 RepID=A0ABW5QG42_9HYPH